MKLSFGNLYRILRQHTLRRYLRRNKISFDSLPSFSGKWPDINNEGRIKIAPNCNFRSFRLQQQITVGKSAELSIAENSYLNDGVIICAAQSIVIGRDAKIADMTYIYDTDFHEVSPDAPIRVAPVKIGNNVWIGAKSMILAGSVIGDHSVIAAGSVVTGNIPAKSLAAGIPAKVIKPLDVPDSWVRS